MLTINPKNTDTSKLHGYLLASIAPRPIALASTIDELGNPNLSPFSFFNVFSANPPILIFSPARRVRNNTTKHTLENAKKTREVVINVVNFEMVHQTSLASTEYDEKINEFEKAGFTMLKSEKVQPYRVGESPVQYECKINDIIELGQKPGSGNLIICEVLRMHMNRDILDDNNEINQFKLDLVARAGGNFYSRSKKTFFEIPKPIQNKGIGVNAIPNEVLSSKILTGNNLGMLGNIEAIPSQHDVNKFMKDNPKYLELEINEKHKFAQELLKNNDVLSAWKVLLS